MGFRCFSGEQSFLLPFLLFMNIVSGEKTQKFNAAGETLRRQQVYMKTQVRLNRQLF